MNKKKKYTATAVSSVVLIIAVIVVINMIVSVLADKISLNIDLTKDNILNFSDITKKEIKKLDTNVKIISLIPQDDNSREMIQTDEILKKYASMSEKVSYSRVDSVKNPSILSKYSVNGSPLSNNYYVIFECDRMYDVVNVNDIFIMYKDSGSNNIMSGALQAEQYFTSSLVKVTRGSNISAAVATGHGESFTADNFKNNILPGLGYNFTNINLMSDTIDEKCDILIISSPKSDYSSGEVEKISKYMKNGGSVQVFADPDTPRLDNLFSFLSEWGVTVEDGIVGDENSSHYATYKTYLIPGIADNEVTKSIGKSSSKALFPIARPISAKSKNDLTAFSIASTSKDGYVKSDIYSSNDNFESGDTKRISDIVVMVSQPSYKQKTPHLLVVGTNSFLGDYSSEKSENSSILDVTGNRGFYSGIMAYMTNQPSSFYIMPKNIVQSKVTISQGNIYVYAFVSILMIPIILLVCGLIVWIRRRHM